MSRLELRRFRSRLNFLQSAIDVTLISFEFDLVQLRRRDGKVYSLRIEKLSAEDQKIVRAKFP